MKQNEEHPRAEVDVEKLVQAFINSYGDECFRKNRNGEYWYVTPDTAHGINLKYYFERLAEDVIEALQQRAEVKRNGGVECDTDEGACACGAWHKRAEVKEESWDDERIESELNKLSISGVAPTLKIEGAKWMRDKIHSPKPKNK